MGRKVKIRVELNDHDSCPVCGTRFEADTMSLLAGNSGEVVIVCACNYLLEWNREREALFVAKMIAGQLLSKGA